MSQYPVSNLFYRITIVFSILVLVLNIYSGLIVFAQAEIVHRLITFGLTKMVIGLFLYVWVILFLSMRKLPFRLGGQLLLRSLGLFLIYGCATWIWSWRNGYGSYYQWFVLLNMLLYPLMLFLVVWQPYRPYVKRYYDHFVVKFYFISSLVVIPFGIIQHFAKSSILPASLFGGYYNTIHSTHFFGKIRVTSFFGNGLGFGLFCAVVVSFVLSKILFQDRNKIGLFAMIGLAIYGAYLTYTRAVYADVLFVILSLVIQKFWPSRQKWLPLYFFVLAVVGLVFIAQLHTVNGLESTASLQGRFTEWNGEWKTFFVNASPLAILFGTGLVQSTGFSVTGGLVIDNTFLAVYIYSGLIGLGVFIYLLHAMWTWLLHSAAINPGNSFVKAVIAYFAAFIPVSLVNNFGYGSYSLYILLIFVALVTLRQKSEEDRLLSADEDSSQEHRFPSQRQESK